MSHLTSHVLDAATGNPAVSVQIILRDTDGVEIARAETDSDGRVALGPDRLVDGIYELRFDTGAYFAAAGTPGFYPWVTVAFTVESDRHYHVPLLLSPFAYSTYRGS